MVATFTYKVRDRSGKIIVGEMDGVSYSVVGRALRDRGLVPLQIEEKTTSLLQKELSIPWLTNRITQKEIVVISRQFATMVNAGVSLTRTLTVLEEQTDSKALAEVVASVRRDVEQGTSLSAAMDRYPKVFNDLYVSMVRAGEIGGVLDETLSRLADILETQLGLRSKMRSAMAYPVVIISLIFLVTSAMIIFVVPVFTDLYEELGRGAKLPLPTQVLIGVSNLVNRFWWFLVAVIGFGIWVWRRWLATEAGRYAWHSLLLRLPVLGSLVHKTALGRFSQTLSVLSRTGVPILQAIDIVADTAGNRHVARALDEVKASIRSGESLAAPMARHRIFPPMVVQMMTVGEETGEVEGMLSKVAEFYEREVEDTVSSMTSLIEPLLIVVMGITVGGILIALYLPIFNIAGLVG